MNSGIVAERYAGAFYGYAKAQGSIDKVYEQTSLILSRMSYVRELYIALCEKADVDTDTKVSLLEAALDPEPLRPEFRSLLNLLEEKDRMNLLQFILLDFLYLYRDRHNIRTLLVTTAVPSGDIPKVFEDFAKRDLKCDIVLQTRVDPEILGGFIVESWDYCCDVSVKRALISARKKLTDSIIK